MNARSKDPAAENELYSVYQFFPDNVSERVRQYVPAEEAMQAAERLTTSVGSKIGTTQRVIITDMLDRTVFEWKHGEGIVFPVAERDFQNTTRAGESPRRPRNERDDARSQGDPELDRGR
jgi:hypothetical protein